MRNIFTTLSILFFSISGFSQTVFFSPQNAVICHYDTCVAFLNQSLNVAATAWNFGDPASGGNNTSTLINPTHCFAGGPGTYTVTCLVVFTNNSSGSATGTIIIAADSAAFTSTSNGNNSVAFTDISTGNPVTWNWDFGDATTSTLQSPSHQYAFSGNYNVRLITLTAYGCQDTTFQNVAAIPDGISDPVKNISFSFYPNPTFTNQIHIDIPQKLNAPADLKIENVLGEIVFENKISETTAIDLSGIVSGIYFVRLNNGQAQKLVVE